MFYQSCKKMFCAVALVGLFTTGFIATEAEAGCTANKITTTVNGVKGQPMNCLGKATRAVEPRLGQVRSKMRNKLKFK